MRAFIVLCLVAVACADKLGYNYHPVPHSEFGLSFTPGSSSSQVSSGFGSSSGSFGAGGLSGGSSHSSSGSFGVSGSSHGSSGSFGVGGSSHGSSGSFGVGVSSHGSSGSFGVSGSNGFGVGGSNGGFSVGGSSGSYSVGGSSGASYNAPQPVLEKEFYTFTANEDDFSEPAIDTQVVNTAKKGLRVIFIKGPENHALENAAVSLAKHAAEQRTAIYVLTKQADVNALTNKLNVINSNVNNKPEVHFVKYRTQEDAVNAQKAIQSQYDALGGTTQNYNGGVAPVLNFASKAPVAAHGSVGSSGSLVSGSLGSSGSLVSGSLGSSGTLVSGSLGSSGTLVSGSLGSSGSLVSGSLESSGLSSGSLGSSGVHESTVTFGSSGSLESSGALGTSGTVVSTGSSLGSSGSVGSVTFSTDGSGVSNLSSKYLPAKTK